jgi:hypothetical protein
MGKIVSFCGGFLFGSWALIPVFSMLNLPEFVAFPFAGFLGFFVYIFIAGYRNKYGQLIKFSPAISWIAGLVGASFFGLGYLIFPDNFDALLFAPILMAYLYVGALFSTVGVGIADRFLDLG